MNKLIIEVNPDQLDNIEKRAWELPELEKKDLKNDFEKFLFYFIESCDPYKSIIVSINRKDSTLIITDTD